MYNDNSETCLQSGLDACEAQGFDGPVDATFTDEDIAAMKTKADALGTGKHGHKSGQFGLVVIKTKFTSIRRLVSSASLLWRRVDHTHKCGYLDFLIALRCKNTAICWSASL